MSTDVIAATAGRLRVPPVPWLDPHTISPAEMGDYVQRLETACEQNPESVDLRVCLGMAYAMNFDAYKSMDTLEAAVRMDKDHYFAQLKYAELLYRLRILLRAEEETQRALQLARNSWEVSLARKLLQQIREQWRGGTQRPAWTKPLTAPFLIFSLGVLLLFLVMWK
jgi:tetratricopeptide (TPR) repeat protein